MKFVKRKIVISAIVVAIVSIVARFAVVVVTIEINASLVTIAPITVQLLQEITLKTLFL